MTRRSNHPVARWLAPTVAWACAMTLTTFAVVSMHSGSRPVRDALKASANAYHHFTARAVTTEREDVETVVLLHQWRDALEAAGALEVSK